MSQSKNPGGYSPSYNPGGYTPSYNPGPTPYYAPPSVLPPDQVYVAQEKSPYEGDRFKPKKRINDPFFTIFFILQVRSRCVSLRFQQC
jgi:hypothetical protein